jgi:hypothetical protein
LVVSANGGVALQHTMSTDASTRANTHMRPYDRVGPYGDTGVHLGADIHNRSGMNKGHKKLQKMVKKTLKQLN